MYMNDAECMTSSSKQLDYFIEFWYLLVTVTFSLMFVFCEACDTVLVAV